MLPRQFDYINSNHDIDNDTDDDDGGDVLTHDGNEVTKAAKIVAARHHKPPQAEVQFALLTLVILSH